jgi:Tfp pilus assembly protein PilO
MNVDDLRRLSFKDVGNWPILPKVLVLGALFVAIIVAGALLDWKDQYETLEKTQGEEQTLRGQYTEKKAKAINFDAYRQQLAEVEQSFGALVKQLPNRSEIDALLTDINQAGLGAASCSSCSSRPRRSGWPTSTPSCRSRSRSPAATTTWARSRATSRSCRAS